ncbi:MAG: hypothetical protein U1E53_13845 [Dongiaceae bacterium]
MLSGTGQQACWHVRGDLAGIEIDVSTLQATREAAIRWVREHQPDLIARAGIAATTASFGQALELYRDLCSPDPEQQRHLDRLKGALGIEPLAGIDGEMLARVANELHGDDAGEAKNRCVIDPAAAVLHFAARNGLCRFVRIEKFALAAEEPMPGRQWGEFR